MLGPLLGTIWNSHKKKQIDKFSKQFRNLPETKISAAAIRVSSVFTEAQLLRLIEDRPFVGAWTDADAIATWYALGLFCLIAVLNGNSASLPGNLDELVLRGNEQLIYQWRMSETVRERYNRSTAEHCDEFLTAFSKVKESRQLNYLFSLYCQRILGSTCSLTDQAPLESALRGNTIPFADPFIATALVNLYIEAYEKARAELLAEY